MQSIPATINFRKLERSDIPTVVEWLVRPHVAEWWGDAGDFEADYLPVIAGDVPTEAFIARAGRDPIGFIQSYRATGFHDEGWWLDERDPGVHGIDQFLADGEKLGQGLGTAMITAFLARLFGDPTVARVQTDPSPLNARAIRCYEKCGFRRHGEIVTLDGPALLMYCEHPTRVPG